ncbi:MAG: NADH-ubiquinone oxidoreductase-F iron-sulfur binding region domain-containing protein, partial [Desulfobacterales bacterium]
RIDDYLAIDGYSALAKVLAGMTSGQVVEEVKKSNLRGRGGGGFPAGRKWEGSRNAPDEIKYVIVNADEGDPGAYMDRSLLEGNPHAVLEGLIIGAYAIGSHEGYIYVRQEYPLAVENVNIAIQQAEAYGFLGQNILGSGFDFTVKVHQGAGAFVSGESTALMTALEGRVGEPRPKYIRSNIKGLWGKPSVLNNVETWANVPLIINQGADWFTRFGTDGSKGTKIFSLVGKITNTGLVEVPMGMTLKDIIYNIGGGIPGGKKFKAVQTGGPSGGCLPEELLDLEVGFDELTKAGSMMGSGGMIVMDEDTCMVDVARYFIDFLTDESCGKCVPCREGLRQMLKKLTNITKGKGEEGDIELLEEISEIAKEASLCALGTSAPNPFLSTVRYFRDEYEAHIKEKRCPALSCKELISYYIDSGKCRACMICLRKCPADAVDGGKKKIHIIDQEKCTKCGTCFEVCPSRFSAVKKISGEPVPPPIPEEERMIIRKSKAQ